MIAFWSYIAACPAVIVNVGEFLWRLLGRFLAVGVTVVVCVVVVVVVVVVGAFFQVCYLS